MARIFLRLILGGLVGKVLGLVREVVLAALFGAGRVAAANRVALTATLIPINFFTADALTAGFLPLYIEYRNERPVMALALYRSVRALLAGFSLVLVVALLFGNAWLIRLLGPGLDSQTSDLAAMMLAVAALGVPFYVQYNLYTLVGLAHDDVRLINLRPSVQSIGLICATVGAYLSGNFSVLAWGFTIPYVLLCCWGALWIRRCRYLPSTHAPSPQLPTRVAYNIALSMFWRRLRPLLLVPLILQGSIAAERAVGSLLGVEVVAATDYAKFVVDSLMALIAAPLGLAGLASFAKMNHGEVIGGLKRLVPPLFLATIPLSLMLCLNSEGVVTLLYARGEFDNEAVALSSVMLLGFSLGIWAQVAGYTFVKILNARGANSAVAVVMAVSFSAAIVVNVLLHQHWGAFTLGVSASICGLLMFVISAIRLSILRYSLGLLLALLPGAVIATIVGYVLRGPGVFHLGASCFGILVTWLAYIAVVPRFRETVVTGVMEKVRRRMRSCHGSFSATPMIQDTDDKFGHASVSTPATDISGGSRERE